MILAGQRRAERDSKPCVGLEAQQRWLRRQDNGVGQERQEADAATDAIARCVRELEERVSVFNLPPDMVHLASEIASLENDLNLRQHLALLVLCVISLAALNQGSSRFPISTSEGKQALSRMTNTLCGASFRALGMRDIAGEIESLLESGKDLSVIGRHPQAYAPLLYLRPYIYHQRVYHAEISLARRLAAAFAERPLPVDQRQLEAVLQDVLGRPPVMQGRMLKLSDEQAAAIAAAARSQVTIISGGPGTGKTSIVAAILRVLARIGIDAGEIVLAAPTGKAAYRMGEALEQMLSAVKEPSEHDIALRARRPVPQTLHRLLAYSPSRGRFLHHHNNPLPASVVIVDEVSMVDLELMRGLGDALRADARLILLGDEEQLPSIAAGAVLRELVEVSAKLQSRASGNRLDAKMSSLSGASVKLRRNYRLDETEVASRTISSFAQAINAGVANDISVLGQSGELPIIRRALPDELTYRGVELLNASAADIEAFLDQWYIAQVQGDARMQLLARNVYHLLESDTLDQVESARLRPLFNHLQSARILCVTRVFATGSERLNAALHARAVRRMRKPTDRFALLPGEPVMVLHNDYTRGLFNGDQGCVLQVRRGPSDKSFSVAVFPHQDVFRAFPLETLSGSVELCYAMTVHKAQGSEFDRVALIMPEEDLPLLTRELLYTALTRSRSSVVLVGQEQLIRAAASRKIDRYSGLAEHLLAALKADG
jgi:exodeoxyribonuclease V alpha subunit